MISVSNNLDETITFWGTVVISIGMIIGVTIEDKGIGWLFTGNIIWVLGGIIFIACLMTIFLQTAIQEFPKLTALLSCVMLGIFIYAFLPVKNPLAGSVVLIGIAFTACSVLYWSHLRRRKDDR